MFKLWHNHFVKINAGARWILPAMLPVLVLELGDLAGLSWVKWFGPAAVHWAELILITPIASWLSIQAIRRFQDRQAARIGLLGGTIAVLAIATYCYTVLSAMAPMLFPETLRGPHGPDVYFEATGVFAILALSMLFIDRARPDADTPTPMNEQVRRRHDAFPSGASDVEPTALRCPEPEVTRRDEPEYGAQSWFHEFAIDIFCIVAGLAVFATLIYIGVFMVFDLSWWLRWIF